MYGEELIQAFREFKSIWDPDWKMNPGKIVEPHRMDQNYPLPWCPLPTWSFCFALNFTPTVGATFSAF